MALFAPGIVGSHGDVPVDAVVAELPEQHDGVPAGRAPCGSVCSTLNGLAYDLHVGAAHDATAGAHAQQAVAERAVGDGILHKLRVRHETVSRATPRPMKTLR